MKAVELPFTSPPLIDTGSSSQSTSLSGHFSSGSTLVDSTSGQLGALNSLNVTGTHVPAPKLEKWVWREVEPGEQVDSREQREVERAVLFYETARRVWLASGKEMPLLLRMAFEGV